MKKLLILISILTSTIVSNGQTTYYHKATTVYSLENGVTYNSDNRLFPLIFLYNAANKYHDTPRTYADGRPFTLSGTALMKNRTFSMPAGMESKVLSLAKAVFTPEQKALLKDALIGVYIEMDASTGRVLEVEFGFLAFEGEKAALIPPSTFRALELVLKNNDVYVTPTTLGRSLSRLGATIELRF